MILSGIDGTPVKLPDRYHSYPANVTAAIRQWVHQLQARYGDRLVSVHVERVLYQRSANPRPCGVFSIAPTAVRPAIGRPWEVHTQQWRDDRWGFWVVAPNNATVAKSTSNYTTEAGAVRGARNLIASLRSNDVTVVTR